VARTESSGVPSRLTSDLAPLGGLCAALAVAAMLAPVAFAQEPVGKPLIHNFERPDVVSELQHWAAVQDARGVMYFANNAGVLEYDGHSWRLIALPSGVDVRSVAIASNGKGPVYVGASGDFGRLEPDEIGQWRFVSLLPPEARSDPSFDQRFDAVVTPSGSVYFKSTSKLCLYEQELRCRTSDTLRSRIFAAGRALYVQQTDLGLMELVGGVTTPVPGGQLFANSDIAMLLASPANDGETLIVGTRDFRFFVRRDRLFEPLPSDARDESDRLTGGALLPDGTIALATAQRGLLIMDEGGRVLQRIDRGVGLRDNHVLALLTDRQGGVWAGLEQGLSRIVVSPQLSVFDESSGLEREWREVVEYGDMLYARGSKGLYGASLSAPSASSPAPRRSLRFEKIAALAPPVAAFVVVDGRLLVSAADGIHEVQGTTAHRVMRYASTPTTLYRSRRDPARVYVGLDAGLASMRLERGRWRDEGGLAGIVETITSIGEGDDGDLWLVSQRQRVLRVARDVALTSRAQAYPLGKAPLIGRIAIREVAGRSLFLTDDGIYEFDAQANRFAPFARLEALAGKDRRSFAWIVEDAEGNLWVVSRQPERIDLLRRQPDGRYVLEDPGVQQTLAWSIHPESHRDVVWICTPDALLRYNRAAPRRPPVPFFTQLRRVTTGEHVVYGGAPIERLADARLPYSQRSLQFEFAAPRFDDARRNEFQSYLEGFESQWSAWNTASTRMYTNLPKGQYRFHVRARDAQGRVGVPALYAFTVLPPWYQTGWAYIGYIVLVCGVFVLISNVEWRRAQVELERQIEHMELEQLRELDGMKSRFFADISHEFRTPLTLILGPVGQMLNEAKTSELIRPLRTIERNAQYLLQLISQLLDLSKAEAGKTRLHASRGDLAHAVQLMIAPFAELAERRGTTLSFSNRLPPSTAGGPELYFDPDLLQKILNNLVANALKFTAVGGTIGVDVRSGSDGFVEIAVSDTGVGIPRAETARVFERFYQVPGGRTSEGIGIGLALVKELVDLHHGEVLVESAEEKGTTFTVRLPVGASHLRADEIVENSTRAGDPAASQSEIALLDVERSDEAAATAGETSDHGEDETSVLVVEDHAEVRTFLRDHLQRHYRVIEAQSGSDGLDAALSALPDLVISDVVMDGMDGFELCRALKTHEKTCHIPVILLTAKTTRGDRLHGLETGADCYLTKPFDALELLVQVRNLIDQRRQLRERFSAPVVLKPSEMAVTPMDEVFLTRVLTAVQSHLQDPTFDVERLGREVGLSRSQLHRKLRALTNQPPTLLIRSIRLQRAAELLAHKTGSVAEVAYFVGFNSQAYFAKCFREQFGCSPREYAHTPAGAAPTAEGPAVSTDRSPEPPVPFRPASTRKRA
jgi:signal transduction histidine kinase/DNA-binding response OmpR family regulator